MKQISLVLLLLLSALVTNAQDASIEKTVFFDFSKPENLTPKINTSGYHLIDKNGRESIKLLMSDYTFNEGPIKLSFGTNVSTSEPALCVNVTPPFGVNNPYWYIQMERGAMMKVNATDVELLSVEFCGTYQDIPQYSAGSMQLESGGGTYRLGKWTNNGEDGIKTLTLRNNGSQIATIPQLKVVYRSPLDVLATPSITPANNATINTSDFDGITLTFTENVSIKQGASFTLFDANGMPMAALRATVNGKVVRLIPVEPVTATGKMYLNIDKGVFIANDGTYNKAFSTTLTLKEAENIFAPVCISPEPTTEAGTEMSSKIMLTFPSAVGFVSSTRLKVYDSKGSEVRQMEASRINSGEYNTVELNFVNSMGDITEKGIYTVTIPEAFIYNNNYDATQSDKGVANGARYNPEIKLTYTVGGAYKISAEMQKKIKDALNFTGIGYPKGDAAERVDLVAKLKTAVEDEEGSDEEMNNALTAYYKSENIVMPESGKYYTIANYGTDGSLTYLAYSNGVITTTSSVSKAAHFKVTLTGNGKVNVETADGKFLHSLVTSNLYSGTSTSNVTTAYDATYNDLTLAKINVEGANEQTLFGKFYIYGAIGTKGTSQQMNYAYSIFTGADIDMDVNGNLYFSNGSSSAFILSSTSAPDPTVTYSVSPANGAVVEQLTTITVTFNNVSSISHNSAKAITLSGKTVSGISVSGNTATINAYASENGTYTLNIPAGAFQYYNTDHYVDMPAVTATYTVQSSDAFKYDLDIQYKIFTSVLDNQSYGPELLNSFYIYTDETEPFINEQANAVGIVNYDRGTDIAMGKLSKRTKKTGSNTYEYLYKNGENKGKIDRYINNNTMAVLEDGTKMYIDASVEIKKVEVDSYIYMLDFIFDQTFNASNTPSARYGFVVLKGSYGDSLFGQYLSSQTVKKSDCHLNARATYYFNIDSTITSITDVNDDACDETIIFDITGRRVNSMSAPGIYIINGKKYLKK